MRRVTAFVLAMLCAVAAAPVYADQGAYPKTDEERKAAYDALQWQDAAGSYKLPKSHAVIQLPSGGTILLGADAERFSWLNNSGIEFPETEAVLASDSDSLVYYEWRDEGYVSDSDWEDVDGEDLLKEYRDSTETSNDQRVKNGFKPIHVTGWLEAPHYDKDTRTVTYALELKDDEGTWANAIALRLGRTGYTELTWVGSIDAFRNASGRPALLDQALATHAFEEGHRYADYKEGDRVAAYGIAGLVATALGVSYGKGILAALFGLLIAGKKLTLVLLALLGGIAVKFKDLFSRFRRRS